MIAAGIHLIEAEICQVHTCFGYPLVNKLYKLLTQIGHDIKHKIFKIINKFHYYYQMKGKTPQHFKFTLKKDIDFNYKIFVDVMYLDGKPIFHVIDAAITF